MLTNGDNAKPSTLLHSPTHLHTLRLPHFFVRWAEFFCQNAHTICKYRSQKNTREPTENIYEKGLKLE